MTIKGDSRSMPTTEPQWVEEMHQHFSETGSFRAADLQRVLGDPRDTVTMSAETAEVTLSRISKR